MEYLLQSMRNLMYLKLIFLQILLKCLKKDTLSVFQEYVHHYQNQVNELKREKREMEQYGRRLFGRVDGINSVENETSDEVFDKVMSLMQKSDCDILEVAIDRAHRIDKVYVNKNSKQICKSIIVRSSTFRHRTKLHRSRSKLKNIVNVNLDLTKSRYTIFPKAIETADQ